MKIKVFNSSKHNLPQYATSQSAGMDLRANIEQDIVLQPNERVIVSTGIHIQLPAGYEAQVRGRSGLAIKYGVIAHLGTIDADYRGDIGAIIINHGTEPFTIKDGDRIAQLVVAKHEIAEWEPVNSKNQLESTERGEGGYGHSGVK